MNENINNNTENLDDLFVLAELEARESERLAVEPYSYWASVFREFRKKPSAIISTIVMIAIILLAIFVPIFSNENVRSADIGRRFTSPNSHFLFGTNGNGQDMWTKVWIGARTSLMIAFSVAIANTVIGLIFGTVWGYFRQLDLIMMEIYNFISNIPAMLYYLILSYVLVSIGFNSILSLIIAMTSTGWVALAYLIRNLVLIYNNREFNIASRTLGSSPARIIVYNLLPYILTIVITTVSLSIPAIISAEVGLAYFGIGLSINDISLGRILSDAYASWVDHPYVLMIPAFVVGLVTIVFYLVGQALSDAIDPKTHQ
jgi:oligopeptide transport system permease protein